MSAKNNVVLTLLVLFLIIASIIAAVALATSIILGYTAFETFNSKPGLITFRGTCNHQYFLSKYQEALSSSMKIGFIGMCVAFVVSILALLIVITFTCGCTNSGSNRHDETGIQSSEQNRNTYINISYPTTSKITLLYSSLTVIVISSYVPFKLYLDFLLSQNNGFCPLQINSTENRAITILNGLVMTFALAALIPLLALNCRVHKRLAMLEMENHSQSFRHQLERMIREIPESERRFARKKPSQVLEKEEEKQSKVNSGIEKEVNRSGKDEVGLSKMDKVESIIYNPNRSLRLHSVVSES